MTKLGHHRFETTNETRAVGKDFQCLKSLAKGGRSVVRVDQTKKPQLTDQV